MMSYNNGSQRKLFVSSLFVCITEVQFRSLGFRSFCSCYLWCKCCNVGHLAIVHYNVFQDDKEKHDTTWNMYSESHVTSNSDSPYAQIDYAIIYIVYFTL